MENTQSKRKGLIEMSGVNKVILVGNVGKDPEVRHTQDGKAIVNLSIATSETWRDKSSGERKEKTEWHRVVIFNEGLAKVAEAYVKKGSKLYIEGQLQTRKWTDKDGVEKYGTEVVLQNFRGELVLLGDKGERQDAPADLAKATQDAFGLPETPKVKVREPLSLDDEVPF